MMIIKSTLILVFIFWSVGCGIDSKYVGMYYEEGNTGGWIELFKNGKCDVVSGANGVRDDWRAVKRYSCTFNDKTISIKMIKPSNGEYKDFRYPEFREDTGTISIDGDVIVSQTGRRFIKKGAIATSQTPSNTPSTSSKNSNASLEKDKAQNALNQWAGNSGKIEVIGVQEMPQQNMARADIKFVNFTHSSLNNYTGHGTAIFSHYNDGRWMLITVTAKSSYDSVTWNGVSIEAR